MRTTEITSSDLTYTTYKPYSFSYNNFSSGNGAIFNLDMGYDLDIGYYYGTSNSTKNKDILGTIIYCLKIKDAKTCEKKLPLLIKLANKYLTLETKGVHDFTFQNSQDGVPTKKPEPLLNSLVAQLLKRSNISIEEKGKLFALILQLTGAKDAINQANSLEQTIPDMLVSADIKDSASHHLLTLAGKCQELKIPLQFKFVLKGKIENTPLHLAIKHSIPALFNAALENPKWINQPGTNGLTPSEWLAITNNSNAYSYLVALYNKGAKLERALAIVGPQVFLHFAHSRHAGDDAPFLKKLAQYQQPIYQKYLEQVELGGLLLDILKDEKKQNIATALTEIIQKQSAFAARMYAYIQTLPEALRDAIIKTVTTKDHPMLVVWKQDNHFAKLQIDLKRIYQAELEEKTTTPKEVEEKPKSIQEQLESYVKIQKATIEKEIAAISKLSATSVSKTSTVSSTPEIPERKSRPFNEQENHIIQQDIKALTALTEPKKLAEHKFAFSILGDTLTLRMAHTINTTQPELIQLITILEKHDANWQKQNFSNLYQAITAGTFTPPALQQMATVPQSQFKERLFAYIKTLEPRQSYAILKKSTEDHQDPIHIIWATARTKKRVTNINRGVYGQVYAKVQELEKLLLAQEKQQLLQLLATAQGVLSIFKEKPLNTLMVNQVFTKIINKTQPPAENPELSASSTKDEIEVDSPIVAIAVDLITNPKSLPHQEFASPTHEEKLGSKTSSTLQKLYEQFTSQAQKHAAYLYQALESGDEKNIHRYFNKISLCNRCKGMIHASTNSDISYDLSSIKTTLKQEYGDETFKGMSWTDTALEYLVDSMIKMLSTSTPATPGGSRFSVWGTTNQSQTQLSTSPPVSLTGTGSQSTTSLTTTR